ncbi:MAG TPA: NAD-dependent epimerase/dehydratase family protein [Nitrococcus sp.]|nr:NAD-dependent epimerase/dehydratase family protein [Nitrococcus sp.]
MVWTVLITGGAGFIGSHLADELLAAGYRVRALDSLDVQVHGSGRHRPDYLDPRVELQVGDVRDPVAVAEALQGVHAVFHFAARVGVGQSMYEMASYMDTNVHGTAVLLEQIRQSAVERLVVASSMSIYGEGLYCTAEGRLVETKRSLARLRQGKWEAIGPQGETLEPLPTPESKRPSLASVYALSKMDQERLCLLFGESYDVPAVALRFFNTYGERQALSNPYTGVLAIFGSRLLNARPPLLFEDGRQRRDFVHVRDVARACRLALETPAAAGQCFNVGSGQSISVLELARAIARVMGRDIAPEVTGEYRTGDIRHCFADISKVREVLGFTPQIPLEQGLEELAQWLPTQQAVDRVDQARRELIARRLAV